MNLRRRWAGYWFLAPYLVLFTVFTLGPLLFGFVLSFLNYDLAHAEPAKFIGTANYDEALSSEFFGKALWATVKFVLMSVPITVPLALLLAVAIESTQGPRQAIYRIGVFAPTVVTISVVGLMWRWFYDRDFGLANALLRPFASLLTTLHIDYPVKFLDYPNGAMASIVLMTIWWTVGGPVLVLLAGLKQIPATSYEAAAIDGATGWRAFWNITLPSMRPALLFTLVINVIGAFQVFGQPYMVTKWRADALDARRDDVHLRDRLRQLPPRLRRGDELAAVPRDRGVRDPAVPFDARRCGRPHRANRRRAEAPDALTKRRNDR